MVLKLFLKTTNESAGRISRNAKIFIASVPLFCIPFSTISAYATLYMLNLGIKPVQIGLINSLSFAIRLIVALLSGYIVNRLGRKYSAVASDIIGWLIPIIIWASATEFSHFLIAYLINSTTLIAGLSFQLYLTEDIEPRNRIYTFNMAEILNILSILFVPIGGYFIGKYTLVPAIRTVYVICAVCVCIIILIKALFLTETSVGVRTRKETTGTINLQSFANLFNALKYIIAKPILISVIILNIIAEYNLTIYNLYLFPYLTKHLGFQPKSASFVPFASAIISFIVLFFVIPKIKHVKVFVFLGLALNIAGTIILTSMSSKKSILLLVLNILCWATSKALIVPIVKSLLANEVEDNSRSGVLSIYNIVLTICMFPIGIVCGYLYVLAPTYPFILLMIAYVIGLIIYGYVLIKDVNHIKKVFAIFPKFYKKLLK